jgi:phenylacetate-coenzyme A ligase PaaK-like adenylate-forming protein
MNDFEMKDKPKLIVQENIETKETKLRETLRRAYKSELYRKIWKTSGFKQDLFDGFDDLPSIPFITREDLFRSTRRMQGKICVAPVNSWFACYDNPHVFEWFPYSIVDFMGIAPMLERMGRVVGLREGDIVLAIVDPPPMISSSIPYLWSCYGVARSSGLEFIIGSMDWYDTLGMSWINFIQKRRPTVIFASTRNALALVEKIQKTEETLIKDVLPNTRIGIFYGKHMETDITKLLESYSLQAFEVYSPTEHMSFCSECNYHRGIHLWLDKCIPEVIPTGSEEAMLLWEAPLGTKGELVITNFAECLPLIRYKTQESIRVEGVDRCACGYKDPRISLYGE